MVPRQTCCAQLVVCIVSLHSNYPWNFYLLHWLLMLLTWFYYTWYAKLSLGDTYVSLAYTASLHYRPKACHRSIPIITLAYFCVWNQPCSQPPTQLSVSTASDGRLSKEGMEMRLCSTSVCTCTVLAALGDFALATRQALLVTEVVDWDCDWLNIMTSTQQYIVCLRTF